MQNNTEFAFFLGRYAKDLSAELSDVYDYVYQAYLYIVDSSLSVEEAKRYAKTLAELSILSLLVHKYLKRAYLIDEIRKEILGVENE